LQNPLTIPQLIILGMHRSGTSCLTGSLEQAGLYLGEVNRKAPHNAKGNRESRTIMDLNDLVLEANGGAWDVPLSAPAIWSQAQRDIRDNILADYPVDRVWGFKDPRTLFTLDGWLEALPVARFVGTFRHPVPVAQSLTRRSKAYSADDGLRIWMAYNRRLLQLHEQLNFPLICFDWPMPRYLAALTRLCEQLHLQPPPNGFDFFETELRHNTSPEDLPESLEARALYTELLERAT